MKIIISGPAHATDAQSGEPIRDEERLQSLHGLRYDGDLCANTLFHEQLNEISISGGAIEIVFDPQHGGLRVVSEYWAPEALAPEQLQPLIDHTLGHWSDGIGEGCFDEWSDGNGIELDLAPFAQDDYKAPIAEQVDDGRDVPRFAHLPKEVWAGRFETVERAIAEKADLDAIYDGHTALLLTIMKQNSRIALMLIEAGANVHFTTPMGTTALMACPRLNDPAESVAVAKALLAKGAQPDVRDLSGSTALDHARSKGRHELAELLSSLTRQS